MKDAISRREAIQTGAAVFFAAGTFAAAANSAAPVTIKPADNTAAPHKWWWRYNLATGVWEEAWHDDVFATIKAGDLLQLQVLNNKIRQVLVVTEGVRKDDNRPSETWRWNLVAHQVGYAYAPGYADTGVK